MAAARLYDGTVAYPHAVDVAVEGDALVLSQAGGWSDRVEAALLRRVDSSPDELRLSRTDRPGWRLVLPRAEEDAIGHLLARPERYGRWIDRVGLLPAVAVGAVLTALVVVAGYLAPHALAPHVPMRWERNVGSALFGDFGTNRCPSAKGQQALEKLVERVAPGSTKGPDAIKVAALDIGIFNAAALPGGYIVVFKPAITETDTDALAGILAHEVAHVRRRHVTEALLRELGIGALIRLFAGDLGANAEQIVSLNYTRSNEAEADADAIAMLRRANISPLPTAKLFNKIAKEQGEDAGFSAEFFQSHPLSAKRANRFAASAIPGHRYARALDRDSEDYLMDMCVTNKNVRAKR